MASVRRAFVVVVGEQVLDDDNDDVADGWSAPMASALSATVPYEPPVDTVDTNPPQGAAAATTVPYDAPTLP